MKNLLLMSGDLMLTVLILLLLDNWAKAFGIVSSPLTVIYIAAIFIIGRFFGVIVFVVKLVNGYYEK